MPASGSRNTINPDHPILILADAIKRLHRYIDIKRQHSRDTAENVALLETLNAQIEAHKSLIPSLPANAYPVIFATRRADLVRSLPPLPANQVTTTSSLWDSCVTPEMLEAAIDVGLMPGKFTIPILKAHQYDPEWRHALVALADGPVIVTQDGVPLWACDKLFSSVAPDLMGEILERQIACHREDAGSAIESAIKGQSTRRAICLFAAGARARHIPRHVKKASLKMICHAHVSQHARLRILSRFPNAESALRVAGDRQVDILALLEAGPST